MKQLNENLIIQSFLNHLENNTNLKRLTTNIDNNKAPVHRWFPFLAGFSHKLVEETIKYFPIMENESTIFDPFMGSGTTGVVGKQFGVNIVGNESNLFLYEICKLKTNSMLNPEKIIVFGEKILNESLNTWKNKDIENENSILKRCYSKNNLKKLVTLRESLNSNQDIPKKYKKCINLAITMSLVKTANVGINVPYISWNNERIPEEAFLQFKNNIYTISKDLKSVGDSNLKNSKVKIYLHDSRNENKKIKNNTVDLIFTSPPYLNNLDYGESLKVFLYFWGIANDWGGITQKIRKKAVVSSTTYYSGSLISKSPENILGKDIVNNAPTIAEEIIYKVGQISAEKTNKKAKKSFDVLTLLYFKDMYYVIEEMYRVLKKNSLAFIIIGDSAPYGVHIPTDTYLGEIALASGFSSYTLKPLRVRGIKWKTLRYRHNMKLRESLLILRK